MNVFPNLQWPGFPFLVLIELARLKGCRHYRPPCLHEQARSRPGKAPASPLELIATSPQLLRYATATRPLQAR